MASPPHGTQDRGLNPNEDRSSTQPSRQSDPSVTDSHHHAPQNNNSPHHAPDSDIQALPAPSSNVNPNKPIISDSSYTDLTPRGKKLYHHYLSHIAPSRLLSSGHDPSLATLSPAETMNNHLAAHMYALANDSSVKFQRPPPNPSLLHPLSPEEEMEFKKLIPLSQRIKAEMWAEKHGDEEPKRRNPWLIRKPGEGHGGPIWLTRDREGRVTEYGRRLEEVGRREGEKREENGMSGGAEETGEEKDVEGGKAAQP